MVDINWLKGKVFGGESGGDYDALFGYANRDGQKFGGTKLTNMTVDQAIEFSNPRGPYAQHVKGQIGRVATPMGGYQIVGTTLRDMKRQMGLTGTEQMTPDMQDRIGAEIYKTQGSGAWEGWGKGGGGGGGGGKPRYSSTTSTMNGGGRPTMGLLDMDEPPKTFKEKIKGQWKSGELMDNLALGFNSMRLNPDQNLGQVIGSRSERRAKGENQNRTAAWLASIGREDLAAAMMSGALDAGDAAKIAMTPEKDDNTAMMKNYEYAKGLGMDDAAASEWARAGGGGSTTTVTMGDTGSGALNKELGKAEATTWGSYMTAADTAGGMVNDMDLLEAALSAAPQDPIVGQLAKRFPGFSSPAAVAQSVIMRRAPEMRVEGSGSTSDVEFNAMLDSLPQLTNYPEANMVILNALRNKATRDMERGQIITRYMSSDRSTQAEQATREALSALQQKSLIDDNMRAVLDRFGFNPNKSAGAGAANAAPVTGGPPKAGVYNPATKRVEFK